MFSAEDSYARGYDDGWRQAKGEKRDGLASTFRDIVTGNEYDPDPEDVEASYKEGFMEGHSDCYDD